MDQDITSLATGLTSALNGYLGQTLSNQQDIQKKQQESAIEAGKEIQVHQTEHNIDNPGAGNAVMYITPDMAEKALPGYGAKMVNDFNQRNPNAPLTINQASDYLTKAKTLITPEDKDTEKQDAHQDKLEKDYADRLQKVVSARSGGLGLTDQKVDQARQLRVLLNQYYDPKTDTYNVPPAQHSELAIGMAKLLSSNGQISQGMEEQLRQKTAKEGLSNALIYAGMDPATVGGPTNSVVKMFRDSIDRQGLEAEHQRDQYITGLKGLAPSKLQSDRVHKLNQATLTSSYKDILSESPDKQSHLAKHPVGRVLVVGPDGKKGTIPASQLDDAIKAGYKQAQ